MKVEKVTLHTASMLQTLMHFSAAEGQLTRNCASVALQPRTTSVPSRQYGGCLSDELTRPSTPPTHSIPEPSACGLSCNMGALCFCIIVILTSGQCFAAAVTRFFTIPALMLNRSSRVMPGLRGTPAVGRGTASNKPRHLSQDMRMQSVSRP